MPARDMNVVRFISANYLELQGLRKVVDGVSLLVLWTIMRVGSPSEDAGLFFGASLGWVVATMTAAGWVARYYREQFGQIAVNNDFPETAPASRAVDRRLVRPPAPDPHPARGLEGMARLAVPPPPPLARHRRRRLQPRAARGLQSL